MRLKRAIHAGALPPPDIAPGREFAVSGFTDDWLRTAAAVIATPQFQQIFLDGMAAPPAGRISA